jgi:hypothetical protein
LSETKSDSKVSTLVVAGLVAALGTVVGGVVKGYWDTSLAKHDFQSKLILRALEPADEKQRVLSLQFLVKANLITEPKVREGLMAVLEEGGKSLPQFLPISASTTIGATGVETVGSARDSVVKKFPTLKGKNIALIGFRVRHGDIIDAVTPIYAEVTSSLELTGEFEGDRTGGTGGGETVLKKAGHVVTGIEIWRGDYFGRSEVVHMQIFWARLTPNGIDPASTVASEKLGSGAHAKISEPPKSLRATGQSFISDFISKRSGHTSGETFLNDIEISQTVIVPNS